MLKKPAPLPSHPQQRKCWALKRVWTLLTVLFCAAYVGVLRFGASLGGRSARLGRGAAGAASGQRPRSGANSSGAAGLAAGFARLLWG